MSSTTTLDSMDITAQAVRVLTLYALAEFPFGNATTVRVDAQGLSFSVSDDGRGHAIDRTVAGSPYLPFIYSHLDNPFAGHQGGPVQLHGLGMSLLNAMCSELCVTVRKKSGTLRITYRAGHLHEEQRDHQANDETGNMVAGTVDSQIQRIHTSAEGIEQWLSRVSAANPGLKLYFNGKALHPRLHRARDASP